MSRSGYSDDVDHNILNLYRGTVTRVIRSKRGQAFLRELASAMDAMPVKALIAGELIDEQGNCCTIGVVCKSRGVDVSQIDYDCPRAVGTAVGIARQMAAEIEYENDEGSYRVETPEERWSRMRKWVSSVLQQPTSEE